MHALFGIEATKYTFVVSVQMGYANAIALIDSGSTAIFITTEFAKKARCQLELITKKIKVVVANGGQLWTEFIFHSCHYEIQKREIQY